jgi:hypothetical protein
VAVASKAQVQHGRRRSRGRRNSNDPNSLQLLGWSSVKAAAHSHGVGENWNVGSAVVVPSKPSDGLLPASAWRPARRGRWRLSGKGSAHPGHPAQDPLNRHHRSRNRHHPRKNQNLSSNYWPKISGKMDAACVWTKRWSQDPRFRTPGAESEGPLLNQGVASSIDHARPAGQAITPAETG